MVAFPTIQKPNIQGFSLSVINPTYNSKTEANYELIRKASFKSRQQWELHWSAIANADFVTLKEFFEDNVAEIIEWNNPDDSQAYNVNFVGDTFLFTKVDNNYWTGSIAIKEV